MYSESSGYKKTHTYTLYIYIFICYIYNIHINILNIYIYIYINIYIYIYIYIWQTFREMENACNSIILSIRYVFYYFFFGLDCFLILQLWSQCAHNLDAIWSISNGNRLIGFSVIWMPWSKCLFHTLHIFYFVICLFICFMLYLFFSIKVVFS